MLKFFCVFSTILCLIEIVYSTANINLFTYTNQKNSFLIDQKTNLTEINGYCIKTNSKCKNYVLIHGFMSSGDVDWIKEMTTELFLINQFTNVIVIDWSNGSMTGT